MTAAFNTTGGYGTPRVLADGSVQELPIGQLLGLILKELQIQSELLRTGLGVADDIAVYRADPAFAAPTTLTNPS